MSREDHLAWCKTRARAYLDKRDIQNAVASMLSDIQKHPETALSPGSAIAMLGIMTIRDGDLAAARRFIEGFN